MSVTSRVRHLIEINTCPGPNHHPCRLPAAFEFESRDIGFTQGTTIRYGHTLIAHYRPGTRYWDRALDIAEQLLATTMGRMVADDSRWEVSRLVEEFAVVLREERCTPWDGTDPNEEE